MLTLEEAQAILAAVGSDAPPSVEQLTAARGAFVSAARLAKEKGDKGALVAMLEAVKVTDQALAVQTELAAAAAAELDALAAEVPELAADATQTESTQTTTEEATARMLTVAEAAARLGLSAETSAVQVEERPRQTLSIGGEDRPDATWLDLAASFAQSTKSATRAGIQRLATFHTEYKHNLGEKSADANSRLLDELSAAASDPAVVAAGGCCTLAEPIRDSPMLASLERPIADKLPTIGATAGAVSILPPVCLPVGGVATWTCVQDAAVDPDDPDTWKVCTHIECAEPQTVIVDAIYRCLTIGNFQARFSPERWASILHATTAAQARLAEIALFNKIATSPGVTTHTITDAGSVFLTYVRNLILAAATIRQNQRYEAPIVAISPQWLKDAIAADRIARAIQRGRSLEGADAETLLAEHNIEVVWSPDLNPIEPNGQVNGPLTQFPATASTVLFVDGGVFRLDGGELNLGTEIRDLENNRQNQVAAFGESFEHALVRSCDTKALTIPVTVCGQAPCTAPAP